MIHSLKLFTIAMHALSINSPSIEPHIVACPSFIKHNKALIMENPFALKATGRLQELKKKAS
jgi:hypothetical protein